MVVQIERKLKFSANSSLRDWDTVQTICLDKAVSSQEPEVRMGSFYINKLTNQLRWAAELYVPQHSQFLQHNRGEPLAPLLTN